MEPAEARIAAHVCADGCVYTYIDKNALQIVDGRRYRQERTQYCIMYFNNESVLLNQFRQDMKDIYNVNRKIGENRVEFRSKRIYTRIKELGGGGSRDWFIADEIKNADENVKAAWLQAFFDDEGTVSPGGRVRAKSMNKSGLYEARTLMMEIGAPAHLTGPNCDGSWYLNVNKGDMPCFHEKIGFTHPKKKRLCKQVVDELSAKEWLRGKREPPHPLSEVFNEKP